MSPARLRLVLLTLTSLALTLAAALVLDWFHVSLGELATMFRAPDVSGATLAIDLRSIELRAGNGMVVSVPLSQLRGAFPTLSTVTLVISLGFAALVAWHSTTHVLGRGASSAGAGYLLGLAALLCSVAAGYLFVPDLGVPSASVTRMWAPLVLVLGQLAGLAALQHAEQELATGDTTPRPASSGAAPRDERRAVALASSAGSPPVVPAPRTRLPDSIPLEDVPLDDPGQPAHALPDAIPLDDPFAPPSAASGPGHGAAEPAARSPFGRADAQRDALATSAAARSPLARPDAARDELLELPGARGSAALAGPQVPAPPVELRYSAWTLDLSGPYLLATRHDGTRCRVAMQDVVGLIARRLPEGAPYDGACFVDVLSDEGATVRVAPWTELIGEVITSEGLARARSLLGLLAERCPAAELDASTRAFLDRDASPDQLESPSSLAAYDARVG